MKKVFYKFVKFILSKMHKQILIISNRISNQSCRFAVKSEFGFWYAGDIFNRCDISHGIASNGHVEKEETKLVNQILNSLLTNKETINFFDVGANTGYYGVLAACLGKGKIQVSSFEPVKEHVDVLNENIILNRLEKELTIYPFALGNENMKGAIFLSGSGSSLEANFNGDVILPKRDINIKTMDSILNGGGNPDFIKIDVEGHELKVLQGGIKTIEASKPVLFVEIAQVMKSRGYTNNSYLETIKFLQNMGYESYYLEGSVLKPVQENESLSDGVYMYLFLHRTAHDTLKHILIK